MISVAELCAIGIVTVFVVLLILTVIIKTVIKLTDIIDEKRREKKLFLELKNEIFAALVGVLMLHTENFLSIQPSLTIPRASLSLWKFADRLENTRISWRETAKIEGAFPTET